VDDIAHLPVALPDGKGSPLGDLADIELRQGASRIQRGGRQHNVIVKANLRGRDQGSFVAEAQKGGRRSYPASRLLRHLGRPVREPAARHGAPEGHRADHPRAIFSLLFWAFKRHPPGLLVLAMVPFTLIGGFAGLAVAGLHLSVSAAVGFIAVAGISVQNGVIMVEQVMEIARRGATRTEAILDGAMLRLRPIVMTALMAGLGLLPAALSHGIGSETQRPFAVVIVGGIVSATVFHATAAAGTAVLRRPKDSSRRRQRGGLCPNSHHPTGPHHAHPHRRRRPPAGRRCRAATARAGFTADYVGSAEAALAAESSTCWCSTSACPAWTGWSC
jgi:cobalt-zinc-cadmium resistance protein CzcA